MNKVFLILSFMFLSFTSLAAPVTITPAKPYYCASGDRNDLMYINPPVVYENSQELLIQMSPLMVFCESGEVFVLGPMAPHTVVAAEDDASENSVTPILKKKATALGTDIVMHLPPRAELFSGQSVKVFNLNIGFWKVYGFKVKVFEANGEVKASISPIQ